MLDTDRLEERINREMAAAKVPGASLCVIHDKEVVYANGFGTTSVEDGGLPVTPRTLFRIGSTSKPLTATAMLRLIEQEDLDLDRPVKSYIPWFALKDSDASAKVTVRHVMTHTSGLAVDAAHWGPRDPNGLERYVRDEIPGYDLVADPGEVFQYSNPAVDVAGYVAEVVAGKHFSDLMQELVFDPLEMSRTTLDPLVAMTYPLAQSHDVDEEGNLRVQHRFADHVGNYPAGFVISTALDMANFALMLLGRGSFKGVQILQPESFEEMTSPQARTFMAPRHAYGLMMMVGEYRGLPRFGHGGGISTFQSQFELMPDSGSAVILQSNRVGEQFNAGALVQSIFDELLDLPAQDPGFADHPADRSRWPRYEGRYLAPMAGVAEVKVDGDELRIRYQGEELPLRCVDDDFYIAEAGTETKVAIGFRVPEGDGSDPVEWAALMGMPARRTEGEEVAVDPAELAALAGTYGGDFAGQTWLLEIEAEEERLVAKVLQPMQQSGVPLTAMGGRQFASPSGIIEFDEGDPAPSLSIAKQLVLHRQ
ncbi:MAG TPA: serine hydrolase [Acidimicrobiales bacterium]|nr:serine hydrolase [Acidimicrobiales bacterium]